VLHSNPVPTAPLAPRCCFPAVWGQRIAYCNVYAILVVAMDIRDTLLASVPGVWGRPIHVCVDEMGGYEGSQKDSILDDLDLVLVPR
jgi:hypothetical protein